VDRVLEVVLVDIEVGDVEVVDASALHPVLGERRHEEDLVVVLQLQVELVTHILRRAWRVGMRCRRHGQRGRCGQHGRRGRRRRTMCIACASRWSSSDLLWYSARSTYHCFSAGL
jgi:hypothetical protein